MSSKGARKSHAAALSEDKDKKHIDSPAKDMKKKVAANAEKEKASDKTAKSAERADKAEKDHAKHDRTAEKGDSKKADRHSDKKVSTPEKNAHVGKADKHVEKNDKSVEKNDKSVEKNDKSVDKNDKSAEKNDKSVDKNDNSVDKNEKSVDKNDKSIEKNDKSVDKKVNEKKEKAAEKKNEEQKEVNVETNGKEAAALRNGDTVSDGSTSGDELMIAESQDEMFPELAYDDSDAEPDDGPSRTLTRRSQVKATKTPETPRPESFKDEESKEKLSKPADPLATDRKLRSADSPKPESKKDSKKALDSPKDKTIDLTEDNEKESEKDKNKLEMDVVIEVESLEGEPRPRTRARVSPYSRAGGSALDQTTSSVTANYSGNNTTMEMDITLGSPAEDPLDSSAYLRAVRGMRGRASYRAHLSPAPDARLVAARRHASLNVSASEAVRPTGTVVGRKRKPSVDSPPAGPAGGPPGALGVGAGPAGSLGPREEPAHAHSKRMRLLDRFSVPFRGFNTRRAAELCGINSDLPLSAPVAPPAAPGPSGVPDALKGPLGTPLADHERDAKRCAIV